MGGGGAQQHSSSGEDAAQQQPTARLSSPPTLVTTDGRPVVLHPPEPRRHEAWRRRPAPATQLTHTPTAWSLPTAQPTPPTPAHAPNPAAAVTDCCPSCDRQCHGATTERLQGCPYKWHQPAMLGRGTWRGHRQPRLSTASWPLAAALGPPASSSSAATASRHHLIPNHIGTISYCFGG